MRIVVLSVCSIGVCVVSTSIVSVLSRLCVSSGLCVPGGGGHGGVEGSFVLSV